MDFVNVFIILFLHILNIDFYTSNFMIEKLAFVCYNNFLINANFCHINIELYIGDIFLG